METPLPAGSFGEEVTVSTVWNSIHTVVSTHYSTGLGFLHTTFEGWLIGVCQILLCHLYWYIDLMNLDFIHSGKI